MTAFQIRKATTADGPAIAEIHLAARAKALPWLTFAHTDEEVHDFFQNVVLAQEEVLVATIEDSVTGFITLKETFVNHLYVSPDHQGIGIGSALLNEAKEWAPALQLWTFQGNEKARAFYKAHGFEEVEFTQGEGNEEREPDVRLTWTRD